MEEVGSTLPADRLRPLRIADDIHEKKLPVKLYFQLADARNGKSAASRREKWQKCR